MNKLFSFLVFQLIGLVCSQDMTVYLASNDVTTINAGDVFSSMIEKRMRKQRAEMPQPKKTLEQTSVVYNSSHPAAFIQTFDETSFGTFPTGFTISGNAIDAWDYDTSSNTLHVVVNGTYSQFTYASKVLTHVTDIAVNPGTTCTGLDATLSMIVVGCLNVTGGNFALYQIVNGALNSSNTLEVTFLPQQALSSRLRVDLSTDSNFLTVFDDFQTQSISNNPAIYLFVIDKDTQAFELLTTFTDAGSSTFQMVHEANIIVTESGPSIYISLVDGNTGFVQVQMCGVKTTAPVALTNCQEQGISNLAITNGRAKYLSSLTAPMILAYNASTSTTQTLTQCLFNSTANLFTDCASTVRKLPIYGDANWKVDTITNYNNHVAVTFVNQPKNQVISVNNILRYQATSTLAVQFDTILESNQYMSFALAQNEAYVLFSNYSKIYSQIPSSNWKIQISARDIPYSVKSNVKVNRALIYITQNPGASQEQFLIRVVVLQNMNSWMGVSDMLPDFGGVPGGLQTLNIDRTWFFGNNLQIGFSGSSIANGQDLDVEDRDDYTLNFDISPASPFTMVWFQGSKSFFGYDGTYLYYYQCRSGENAEMCFQASNVTVNPGYVPTHVIDSTTFPEIDQSISTCVFMKDTLGHVQFWYVWKQDLTKNVIVQLGTTDHTFKSVHMINMNGNLMFFTAPSDQWNNENLIVLTGVDTPQGVQALLNSTAPITPSLANFPAGYLNPTQIKSCAHNDYVIEYLSGHGYIIKLNVLSIANIQLRAVARLTNPSLPNFNAVDFCPFGDEFLVWDNSGNLFSKSTVNDNSYYDYQLGQFGFVSVTGVTCARASSAAGIWGKDASGNTIVATIFGNQFYSAQSKIHSVQRWKNNDALTFAASFPVTKSGILHVTTSAQSGLVPLYMVLAGPYVNAYYESTFSDPWITMTLTSGNETRVYKTLANLHQVNYNVSVVSKSPQTIGIGSFNLENATDIIGHVDYVNFDIPASLQNSVSFTPRNTFVPNPPPSMRVNANLVFKSILGNSFVCTLYQGLDPIANTVVFSLRGTGCNNDFDTGKATFGAVAGRLEVSDQWAVVAAVSRLGGKYSTTIYYIPFSSSQSVDSTTDNANRGFINVVKIARVPNAGQMTHAVFLGITINNFWSVTKVVKGAGVQGWDVLENAVNVWPIESNDAAMVFFNNYRDTSLNFYTLTASSPAGRIQTIQMDGTLNEYKDIRCFSNASLFFTCAMVSYTPVITIFNASLTTDLNISFNTRTLAGYTDVGGPGSYNHVDIIPGYVIAMSSDDNLDIYKVDAKSQGYLYTRIPELFMKKQKLNNSRVKARRSLKFSNVHEPTPNTFGIAINTTTGLPYVVLINHALFDERKPLKDVEQQAVFTVQPLTLTVSSGIQNADLNNIKISLGNANNPVQFNLSQFVDPAPSPPGPTPPTPDKKKSLLWLWIILIIIGVAGLAGAGYFVYLKYGKKNGTEDAYYQKNNPESENQESLKKPTEALGGQAAGGSVGKKVADNDEFT